MLGTDNLKRLIDVGLGLGQKVAADLKDKKISFFEALGLVPDIFAAIATVKTLADVKTEILDLDANETIALETYVMAKWKVPKEKVKTFIDHAITQVFSLISLVNEFKHINDPVVTEEPATDNDGQGDDFTGPNPHPR